MGKFGIIGLEKSKVVIPHDPDNWMILRTALSPAECQEAREEGGFRAMGRMAKAMGDEFGEVMDSMRERALDADQEEVGEANSPERDEHLRSSYDLAHAANKLVRSWSYRFPDNGGKVPVNRKYIDLLDETTRDWLFDRTWEAMRLHIPKEEREGN